MAAVRILLALFCFAFVGSSWGFGSNNVGYGLTDQKQDYGRGASLDEERKKLIAIAQKEIGVQESVENSGKRVDQYNAYVGFKKVAWCASFVSFCFGQAGYPQPRTAWSPALFPADRLAKNPLAGMVLGVYFPELKRVAHCGIVAEVRNGWVISVEGNTNLNGSREGTGVYKRWRHIRTIHRFADWIKPIGIKSKGGAK